MLTRHFIQGFLEGARRRGYDIASILKEAGLDPIAVENPNAQFNGQQLQCLFDALMRQLDDLFLGFVKERHKPVLNLATLKMAMDTDTLHNQLLVLFQYHESMLLIPGLHLMLI